MVDGDRHLGDEPGVPEGVRPDQQPELRPARRLGPGRQRGPALEEALVRIATGGVEVVVAPDRVIAELIERADGRQRLVPGRAVGQDLGTDLEGHRAGSSSPGRSIQSVVSRMTVPLSPPTQMSPDGARWRKWPAIGIEPRTSPLAGSTRIRRPPRLSQP